MKQRVNIVKEKESFIRDSKILFNHWPGVYISFENHFFAPRPIFQSFFPKVTPREARRKFAEQI